MNDAQIRDALQKISYPVMILYGARNIPVERVYRILSIPEDRPQVFFSQNLVEVRRMGPAYDFTMTQITSKNASTFKQQHAELMKYRETYIAKKRYLILSQYEDTIPLIQGYLRKSIECSSVSVINLLLTTRLSAVHPAIKSRAIALRLYTEIPLYVSDPTFTTPSEMMGTALETIYAQDMELATKHTYQMIRSIAKDIFKYNLSVSECLRDLVERIHRDITWTHRQKYEVISYVAHHESLYHSSYRKLLYLEGILFHLYQIRNTPLASTDDEIQRDQEEEIHVLTDTAGPQQNDEYEESHIDVRH
jgi:hypothetical protein